MTTNQQSRHIGEIVETLSTRPSHVTLTGLKGSSPAYILSLLLNRAEGPLFVVTPDAERAEELCNELRFFAGRSDAALYFPPWDTTPFEQASPHPDTTGQRLNALFKLMDGKALAVVVPVAPLMQKVLPRKALGETSQYLVAGEEVEREILLRKLLNLGYSAAPLVEDRSTFSIRGGIVDIFPPNLDAPVRVEFFGDFIDTIRSFDPLSQRSLAPLEELVLLPGREVILSEETLKAFAPRLKQRCDDLDIPPSSRRELLEQLQNSIYPQGVEYLQPLIHPGMETLFHYAPDAPIAIIDPAAVEEEMERFAAEIDAGAAKAQERDSITCAREELFLSMQEISDLMTQRARISIPELDIDGEGGAAFPFRSEGNADLRIDISADSEGVLKPLVDKVSAWLGDNSRVIFTCRQQGQIQRLYDLLSHYPLPLRISDSTFPLEAQRDDKKALIIRGDISQGFRLPEDGLAVIAEEEIFGRRVKRRGISEARKKQILTSLAELKLGDYMVHLDFGVCLYRGLQHLTFGGTEGDFLLLEYAGGDKLYLPVDRINLVQRYVGAEGIEPHLDRLGGAGWEKAKAKAKAAIEEMAEELLKIYAERQMHEGIAFSPPDDIYSEFEASFKFEETPDQMSAIQEVLRDMENKRPMDRLVCGDVGYGKTEVALRAAFKAAMDGKQVAVLVPTTVLAQQHLETFRERLAPYPVKVEMVSRFRSPKEQRAILEEVKKGGVDIIIGTHRLLQKDVEFRDLGLVIIDEEQRFGVAHKERLKRFRTVVDVLTLTATPIPRTLYMSIMGIRDLSIIDTPPVDRLAIKTFVSRFSDEVIREAIMREMRRGGQIFFVHNRVQSIGAMAEHLQRIAPEAGIAVAHGQMDEKELERVMLGFMHGEFNVLLCTAIIESGLDIPRANTIIINRADTFGLAQLYQLRGRVGRSSQRAFAYFLIPGEGAISSDARQRLKVLQELTELGAGFRIATHDMEIRGGGDLLGSKQSGQIAEIGFELYTELLEETISKLKGEERAERIEPEINLHIPAFVPEDYVKDPNQRLVIYKKLTQAAGDEDVAEVMDELVDRFGKLPLTVEYLLEIMRIRLRMKALLAKELEFDGKRLVIAFHERTPVSPDTIIGLIRNSPKKYRFTPDFRLMSELTDTSFEGILAGARNLLKTVG